MLPVRGSDAWVHWHRPSLLLLPFYAICSFVLTGRQGMRGMRRRQRACPPHELVEHHSARVDQVRIIVKRLPLGQHTDKCLEPDMHREAERSHSQLDGCEPQMFDRPRRSDATVTNVTNRLVFPLFHRVVQGVLQNSLRPVIVLGSAYDEAVELCDL